MKRTLTILSLMLLMVSSVTLWQSCKKKDSSSNSSSNMVLAIQTGARTTDPDQPVSYTAVLVDANGAVTSPSSVTWSVTSSLGAFAGSAATAVFTPSATGYGTITASTTVNGKTLTAKVPVGVFAPGVFAVVPSAVIWSTNAGTIPLTPVYIGTGTTGYSYSSSDASVASVSSTGEITFNKVGECVITVTATGLNGNPAVQVPVLVVGLPDVALPVVRVAVTPPSAQLFRGENQTLTAKAYNSGGAEVSSTFTWISQDPTVASVDASGHVTALKLGKTVVTATASGITGQAEIDVLPDTTIILAPYWASIAASGTQQFTATTYTVNHTTHALSVIANPSLTWSIPTYGMSIFDIASVNSTGLVTMHSDALLGLGSFVIAEAASPTIEPGVAAITVSDCSCGTTTSGVTHIGVTSATTVNISLTGSPTSLITAAALDASNNPVSGATLNYCSSNIGACTVDATGLITGTGIGTSTVTICNGGVQTTITVNVNF